MERVGPVYENVMSMFLKKFRVRLFWSRSFKASHFSFFPLDRHLQIYLNIAPSMGIQKQTYRASEQIH